jgi:hypothetical protein
MLKMGSFSIGFRWKIFGDLRNTGREICKIRYDKVYSNLNP